MQKLFRSLAAVALAVAGLLAVVSAPQVPEPPRSRWSATD